MLMPKPMTNIKITEPNNAIVKRIGSRLSSTVSREL